MDDRMVKCHIHKCDHDASGQVEWFSKAKGRFRAALCEHHYREVYIQIGAAQGSWVLWSPLPVDVQGDTGEVAASIMDAVQESRGAMQTTRPCKHCGKPLKVGGYSFDPSADGNTKREYCNGHCRKLAFDQRRQS